MSIKQTKAVIDIGTNTFHLLIAEVDEQNNIHVIHKTTIAVKLGEGGVNKGYIADSAYERGINALIQFRKELNEHQITKVKATATAAVRDASNGANFIKEALEKANIHIDIIDGLLEATYIYKGAKAAGVLNQTKALIMDIGGGSVEFIIANNNEIFWKNSFQLGAARLLADYYTTEAVIAEETINKMEIHFEQTLESLFEAIEQNQPEQLIGTAGSFDSFASITAIRNQETFNPVKQKEYNFEKSSFIALLNEIISSSHEYRNHIKGLIPLRVDMILMASILTKYVIETGRLTEITTCSYSLKEGLMVSF